MSRIAQRVSMVVNGQRRIATLQDADPALGVALIMDDSGRQSIVDLSAVEQWLRMEKNAQEKTRLMRAYEMDRDRGTGQDEP